MNVIDEAIARAKAARGDHDAGTVPVRAMKTSMLLTELVGILTRPVEQRSSGVEIDAAIARAKAVGRRVLRRTVPSAIERRLAELTAELDERLPAREVSE